jgi:hypothetical protein
MLTIYRDFSELAERRRLEAALPGGPEPVYGFSKIGSKVLLNMLDRAIGGYVPDILLEKPELVSAFSGFTWYPNTVSFGKSTLYGSPPLFGGYEYTPLEMQKRDSEPLVKKHNEALLVLPRLFSEIGYRVTVTNPSLANYKYSSDLSIFNDYPAISAKNSIGAQTNDWLKKHPGVRSQAVAESLQHNLIRFSLFKCAPPALRELLYDKGNWLSASNFRKSRYALPKRTLDNYVALDILPEITEIENDAVNTFTVLVNELTHEPGFLEEPDYTVPTLQGNSTPKGHSQYHVTIAAFLLLEKWFAFLKENEVYDTTRIIIVSDHGYNLRTDKRKTIRLPSWENVQTYNPLLMVKDFNKEGDIAIDNSFMSNADVPLLSLDGIIENPVNPFTHKPIQAEKNGGITLTTSKFWTPGRHPGNTFDIRPNEWLHVHDNIFDRKNWKKRN